MASISRLSLLFCSLASVISAAGILPRWSQTSIVPAAQYNGATSAQFVASANGLDAPHVQNINGSAYEWWYFDAVSADGKYSVVVTFYTAPATAFPAGGLPTDIVLAQVQVGIPGQSILIPGNANSVFADEAVIYSSGNGASGAWVGTGIEFVGSSDLSAYIVAVNSNVLDVTGAITFKTIAPGHYPCSGIKAGASMAAFPHLGWAVGIPDAIASVDLNVNGTAVKFTGIGYHDKNWGDIPFAYAISSSNWGHGRLGPYSLVWSRAVERATGIPSTAGFISIGGKTIAFGCTGFTMTPTADPAAYTISIVVDGYGTFQFTTAPVAVIGELPPIYQRNSGTISGGFVGGTQYTGGALYEFFNLG